MVHRADLAQAKNLLSGVEREFTQFFNDYYPRLYRFVLVRCNGDTEFAEDMAQSTLINAMRGMGNYRGDASMFSWLCQICRNEMSTHHRRLGRSVPTVAAEDDTIQPLLELLESDECQNPDANIERMQLLQLLHEVLDRLPTNYGDALECKYVRGESVTEIAERLGITHLAAQSLLARARTSLRDALNRLSPHFSSLST